MVESWKIEWCWWKHASEPAADGVDLCFVISCLSCYKMYSTFQISYIFTQGFYLFNGKTNSKLNKDIYFRIFMLLLKFPSSILWHHICWIIENYGEVFYGTSTALMFWLCTELLTFDNVCLHHWANIQNFIKWNFIFSTLMFL